MIPKKIHAIWYGGTMPADVSRRLKAWRTVNPDFAIRVWGEADSPMHLPYLQRAIRLRNWANASNLMRLWILDREGGIYLDTDVDLVRPFDGLMAEECFLGFESSPDDEKLAVNNAVLGSTPGHPFVQECLTTLLMEFDGTEPAHLSSPVLTTRLLCANGLTHYGEQRLSDGRVLVCKRERFYPYGYDEAPPLDNALLSSETVAIHRWHKSWKIPVASFWERTATRLLAASLYSLERLANLGPVSDRILQNAKRRCARRRLLEKMEVQSGLFKGLCYSNHARCASALNSKLLGTYEYAVQRVLAGWVPRDYRVIYDVGCECGMLLAGLAALFPRANLLGFDTGNEACEIAKQNLAPAGNRAHIFNRPFRWNDISETSGRSLMVCDIEGGERDLFNQNDGRLPDDLIIELHEFRDPTLPEYLVRLLERTHSVQIVREVSPSLSALDGIPSILLGDAARLGDEDRPNRTSWLVCERK